jgi:hypothetical protein
MAVAAKLYGKSMEHFVKGEIAFLTDACKVMLMVSAYAFNQDLHNSRADVVANEVATGAGYTARGATLVTKSVTYDATLNRTRLFSDPTFWTPPAGQSLTARHAIIYKDSSTDASSWLMGYIDLGVSVTATGSPLTLSWDVTDGLLYVDVAV